MCHDVRIARGATRIAPTVCGHEPLQVCAAIASHPCCPGVAEDVKVHESKPMWRQSALLCRLPPVRTPPSRIRRVCSSARGSSGVRLCLNLKHACPWRIRKSSQDCPRRSVSFRGFTNSSWTRAFSQAAPGRGAAPPMIESRLTSYRNSLPWITRQPV